MLKKGMLILAKLSLIFVITILGVLLILPSLAKANDTYATLNVLAKDANGLKVMYVNFNVFEQKYDINGNKIFGERINGGYIKETGLQSIQIKNSPNITKVIAIEYYKNDRNCEKFILWDQKISGLENKDINLILSSVRLILRDADNNLLKNLSYEIWSAITDVYGNIVAKAQLYGNEKTEVPGVRVYYFIPGNYILKIRYPDINNIEALNYKFVVNQNQQTDLTYTLNLLQVTAKDYQGNLKKNAEFKLYYEQDDEYKEIGNFNTGDSGLKKLYLPQGDYKIEFKNYNGKFDTVYNFSLSQNDKKEFAYNYGSLRLKILDTDEDPVPNARVMLYKYANSQLQGQIYNAMTNNDGYVEVPLSTNYYVAQIEGIYHGLIYQTSSFYVNENTANNLEYILSKARIYLQDSANQILKNTVFTLYYYNSDSQGNPKVGSEIGTFSTATTGFAEINLPPMRYIVKPVSSNNIYPISIAAEKLNNIYVSLNSPNAITNNNQNQNSNTNINTNSNINTNTNTNNQSPAINNQQSTSLIPEDLYSIDSDNDGLANFEEKYIYDTNPFDADSDDDNYNDSAEVKFGFNPNGSGAITYRKFSYGKPRVNSLTIERNYALNLRKELIKRIGRDLKVSLKDWRTLVNAYIYGGYSIDEIKNTIVYGPGMVHPTIPAYIWRNSIQYNRAHH